MAVERPPIGLVAVWTIAHAGAPASGSGRSGAGAVDRSGGGRLIVDEQVVTGAAAETVGGEEIRKVLEKVDKESTHRELHGWQGWAISVIAVAFSGFHIYTALFGVLDAHLQRAVHLGFVLTLVYLLYPVTKGMRRDRINPVDLLFVAPRSSCLGYLLVNYRSIVTQAGRLTPTDVVVGTVGILLLFEAARRIVGLPMVIIAALFVLYALFGEWLPGVFAHRNISIRQLVNHLWFTIEGVFGIPLGVSATFVFMFLLFAAFIEITGVGQALHRPRQLARGLGVGRPRQGGGHHERLRGHGRGQLRVQRGRLGQLHHPDDEEARLPARVRGRRGGSRLHGRAADAADHGSRRVPDGRVPQRARTRRSPRPRPSPRCCTSSASSRACTSRRRSSACGACRAAELPKFLYILRTEGINFIPLVAIIVLLTASGFSLLRIALLATASAVLAPLVLFLARLAAIVAGGKASGVVGASPPGPTLDRETAGRFVFDSVKTGVVQFFEALIKGARSALGVATACALAGVIVGVVTRTGLGLKLASALVDIANGRLLLTMFFTMVTSLILGMGVPTTANYIITSTIAAPALLMLGVAALPAHLFVFYFGIIADLTPPVALAAYAGAAIARANPFKTGVTATRLAVGAFILPYIFVANPQLLLIGATPLGIVQAVADGNGRA